MASKMKITMIATMALIGQASTAMAAPAAVAGIATNRTALAIPAKEQTKPDNQCRAADGTSIACPIAGDARGGYLARSWPVLLGAIAAASLGVVAAVSGKSGAPSSP
ncbi:hypothetical protein [Sphingomonas sp. PP-CC-3G-468]|uniref:hypothetical protein n=1 Tax=Sphingomonas sp. PP-CC-3G-468 TaxID=2135656 RepID=UPI0010F08EC3|nr:hypothetical protein [Sphingomonas sp. PP-CC-3G-468]TCM07510.1 hypothetical protein C8J41_103418 [Sphingomonas sp. PP-CC-3G-468]